MTEKIDICINVVNTKTVKQTEKELDDLGKAGSDAGKKIEKSFKQSSQAAEVFKGALGAGAVIGLFRGITSAVGNFGSAVINEAKKIETFTTQFTTLTGSVEAAEQQIKELQDFAASTPFQLEGIADSAKVLLSFGFQANQTTSLLQQIGDVAAISGKPLKDLAVIFGQVEAAGKLTGERFNQLVEAGVNVGPEIANILNISEKAVRTAISTGQVTSDVFKEAFASLSEEGGIAFNGMIALSQTLGGVQSTLADNFSLIAADIGKELLPIIKSLAIDVIDLSQSFRSFFIENIEEIKIFSGAIIGLGVGFGILAVKLGLATIGVTSLSTAFTAMGLAASAAWTFATGPIGLIIIGLTAIGGGIVAITNNYKGFGEAAKNASASVLDFVSVSLDYLSQFEAGFRTIFGTIAEVYLSFVDIYLAGIQKLAETSDKLFGTNIEESISNFRTQLDNTVESFKNGDGVINEFSTKIKIYAGSLRESAQAQKTARVEEETRIETLKKLREEQDKLIELTKTGDKVTREASAARLDEIVKEIAKLEGRKVAIEKQTEIEITGRQQLLEINKKFNETNSELEKQANGESLSNLKSLLESRRIEQIKALRDQAVKDSDFQTASLAQQELNEANKTSKLIEAKLARQAEIDKLDAEQADIDTEKKEIKAELKLVDDEKDKEDLKLKLEELEIIKLESEVNELNARGQHLKALQTQRKLDTLKSKKELKVRRDSEIIADRAHAQVKRTIEQTTAEQIIGIGDNLTKAGILQGKTAGKALQGIKIADATISTFAGATKALELGFPAGLIAAASITASGLANIATIKSQKFATGGIVQPVTGLPSRGIDQIPAQLSVGEEILTRNNPRHRDNISREQDEAMLDEIRGLRTDIQSLNMSVNIDGKEVADVIQEQRFRGVR